MLDQALDMLDPHIAELIFAAIATYFGWVFRYIFKTKQSQDSLHRALGTGVDLVTDALVALVLRHPAGFAVDQFAGTVVNYVRGSVPGALRWLLPSEAQLMTMAEAKLKERTAEIMAKMGPDKLAQALRDAGAPVQP